MLSYEFTQSQISFMESYCPADPHFTSNEEIRTIKDKFEVGTLTSEDKYDLRDGVVGFYHQKMQDAGNNTDKVMDYMHSMQSITTVIDYSLYG